MKVDLKINALNCRISPIRILLKLNNENKTKTMGTLWLDLWVHFAFIKNYACIKLCVFLNISIPHLSIYQNVIASDTVSKKSTEKHSAVLTNNGGVGGQTRL